MPEVYKFNPIITLTLLLSLQPGSVVYAQPELADTRTATSTINGQIVKSEYPLLPGTSLPSNTAHSSTDNQTGTDERNRSRQTLSIGHGLWIYDLLINLTVDNDADGHYSTFSITLDIDNSFNPRDVYAVLYLSRNNGPWLEYAVTSNFTVSGNSASDSISIVTSLETGYPSDYYDLHAEIFDANTNELLLTYGPAQSGHVIGIPFESEYSDNYPDTGGYTEDHFTTGHYTAGYYTGGHYTDGQSSVNVRLSFSGSGSFSWFTLLLLLPLIAYRAYRHIKRK